MKINSLNNQLASENDSIMSLDREISNLKAAFRDKNVRFCIFFITIVFFKIKELVKKSEEAIFEQKNEMQQVKLNVESQEMNKEQEEKMKSEIVVQEQYKQFLLNQKFEKSKLLTQSSSKIEEIYLEVHIK